MNFGGYSPYFNNNPYQQLMQMQNQQQQVNSSFIHVPSEEVARAYTVAPGGSVTFINDNAPYCYTKTAGVNQFDTPVFRKFRLVEETSTPDQQKSPQSTSENSSPKFTPEALSGEINQLKLRIETLESKFNNSQPQTPERKMKNESFKH